MILLLVVFVSLNSKEFSYQEKEILCHTLSSLTLKIWPLLFLYYMVPVFVYICMCTYIHIMCTYIYIWIMCCPRNRKIVLSDWCEKVMCSQLFLQKRQWPSEEPHMLSPSLTRPLWDHSLRPFTGVLSVVMSWILFWSIAKWGSDTLFIRPIGPTTIINVCEHT